MALASSGAVTLPISAARVALSREMRQRCGLAGACYAYLCAGYNRRRTGAGVMKRRHKGSPMDLPNMRARTALRSLSVSCAACHQSVRFNVDAYPDHILVVVFGPICTGCGMIGADARPDWTERAPFIGTTSMGVHIV